MTTRPVLTEATLPARWSNLWRKLGITAAPDIAPLLAAYRAPGRQYHNLDHVIHGLAVYDRNPMQDPIAELALWTHDVIYDPRRSDNEDASATWCTEHFSACMPTSHLATLRQLIHATRHDSHPEWIAAQVVIDADLSVFGGSDEAFITYENNVRAEYAFVDDATWRKGRIDVLSRFMNRPSLYLTAWFREQFEAVARRNLNHALQRLTAANRAHQAR